MLIVRIRLGFDANVTLALKTRRVYEVLGWSAWSEKDSKYVTFSERRTVSRIPRMEYMFVPLKQHVNG